MMIARIEFESWIYREKLSDEDYAKLRELIPDVPEDRKSWYRTECLVDLSIVLPALLELGITPTVKAVKSAMLIGFSEKLAYLETQQKLIRQEIAVNGMVAQVHIPNLSLFNINEVYVLEDGCTNTLQAELNEGWRLLCVCPPSAQRRPDYILGRWNKEK